MVQATGAKPYSVMDVEEARNWTRGRVRSPWNLIVLGSEKPRPKKQDSRDGEDDEGFTTVQNMSIKKKLALIISENGKFLGIFLEAGSCHVRHLP